MGLPSLVVLFWLKSEDASYKAAADSQFYRVFSGLSSGWVTSHEDRTNVIFLRNQLLGRPSLGQQS